MARPGRIRLETVTSSVGRTRRRGARVPQSTKTYVKSAISRGKERKFFLESTAAGSGITNTLSFVNLTDSIVQGDGQSQRIGDVVDPTYLHMRLLLARDSTAAADTIDYNRVVIFQWRPSTADETPTGADLLEDTATIPYLSPTNLHLTSRRKFKILYDKVHVMYDPTMPGWQRIVNIKVGAKRLSKIMFDEAATTGKNHIYMCIFGAQPAGNDNSSYGSQVYLYYKDL